MKKIFFLAAAAIALMTSCTKTELVTTDNDRTPISFENFVHKTTKAAEANAGTLESNGFVVSAYYTPTSGTAAYYFENIPVTYATDHYPTTYYWPIEGKMDFYAVYPTSTITNKTIANYTTEGAEDLLGAVKTGEDCATHNTTKTTVPLQFNHLLTQIYFEIKGEDTVNSYKVEKIILEAKDDATYTYSSGAWSTPVTKKTYTYYAPTSAVAFTGANYTVFGTKVDNSLMLIPQQDVIVKVYYTVETPAGAVLSKFNEDTTDNNHQYKSFTASSSTVTTDVDWTKGTTVKYQLTLPIGVNPIEFTATVTDWATGTAQAVTL